MAKATVKITTTKTRTLRSSGKSTSSKGSGQKRCPTCGRYR